MVLPHCLPLQHACGVANDASILAHDMKQVDWQGAIVILWSEIAEYIREGNQTYLGKRVPHLWFAHMITVAEMLFVTCKALQVRTLILSEPFHPFHATQKPA